MQIKISIEDVFDYHDYHDNVSILGSVILYKNAVCTCQHLQQEIFMRKTLHALDDESLSHIFTFII